MLWFFQVTYNDATIACDGKLYPVHRFVLSVASSYFAQMFTSTCGNGKHPIIVLKDISKETFEILLKYIYLGEVNVERENFAAFINAARALQLNGLGSYEEELQTCNPSSQTALETNATISDNSKSKQNRTYKRSCKSTGQNEKGLSDEGTEAKKLRVASNLTDPPASSVHLHVNTNRPMPEESSFGELNSFGNASFLTGKPFSVMPGYQTHQNVNNNVSGYLNSISCRV